MTNLLGATQQLGSYIGIGILVIIAILYLVFGFKNRKKQQEEAVKMMNELKVGDKVVTNAGIYGEIVSLRETNMGKVVIIKTGHDEDAKKASYITINVSVILGIDRKEDLILDAEGNVIEPEDKQALKEKVLKEKADQPEETEEEKQEEKPKKKAPAKKKTTKKAEAPKPAEATADANN